MSCFVSFAGFSSPKARPWAGVMLKKGLRNFIIWAFVVIIGLCIFFWFQRKYVHDYFLSRCQLIGFLGTLLCVSICCCNWLIFIFLRLPQQVFWRCALFWATLQSLTGKLQGRITTQGDPCIYYREWVHRVQLSSVLVTFLSLF